MNGDAKMTQDWVSHFPIADNPGATQLLDPAAFPDTDPENYAEVFTPI
jgi:hypothetical protein